MTRRSRPQGTVEQGFREAGACWRGSGEARAPGVQFPSSRLRTAGGPTADPHGSSAHASCPGPGVPLGTCLFPQPPWLPLCRSGLAKVYYSTEKLFRSFHRIVAVVSSSALTFSHFDGEALWGRQAFSSVFGGRAAFWVNVGH